MTRSLDLDKIRDRISSEKVTTQEALKDIAPFEWPTSVLNGTKRAKITDISFDRDTSLAIKTKIE